MGGDKPTDEDNGDHLGYGVYAQTLWNRVEAALNKDHGNLDKLGDDPLVVGIFGEWGAGKSKLLSLILKRAEKQRDERIAAHELDGGFSLTVPVFFQPWKYEHERHLLVPLLLHIEAELSRCLTLAENTSDKAKGAVVAVAEAVKAHVPAVVGGFKTLWGAARTAYQLAEPASAGVLLPLAEWLAGQLASDGPDQKKGASPPMAKFRWDAEGGRSYYELNEVLKAVTRPTPEGIKKHIPNANVDTSFRINFVIFIDDLDRCLPEKAVETLELIKTVFNLESFAFVLALDEEVVERGIGHRYKDYALQNKKPEMPITGFEYLEKIVHLPFRLPALSRSEGLQFLETYEQTLLKERGEWGAGGYRPQAWFGRRETAAPPARSSKAAGTTGSAAFLVAVSEGLQHAAAEHSVGGFAGFHLGHAVVNAFDAFVPRKLIRVVELFHQVVEVAHERKRPVDEHLGGERDPRWVLVFVMLQLFHPDLYRLLRRQGRGVDVLRDSFAQGHLRAEMADMDLLAWACYQTQPVVDLAASLSAIAAIKDDDGKRYPAQRLRLPIAERLLDHRAVQRHVFDPLKLFEGLTDTDAPFAYASTRGYFSLLSQVADESEALRPLTVVKRLAELAQGEAALDTGAPNTDLKDGSTEVEIDVERLFVTLTSAEPSERRGLSETMGLQHGQKLPQHQVHQLIERAKTWLPNEEGSDRKERLTRLQDGLRYLASFLNSTQGRQLWALLGAKDPEFDPKLPCSDTETLKQVAQSADLYTALGLDERFDSACFYLPKHQRVDHGEEEEPLPGFVWVQKERADFKPKRGSEVALAPFLMARYLTTVDQFAAFVDADGYKSADWWDSQGWAWVTGEWDRHPTTTEWLRKRLGQRPVDERQSPAEWARQRPWGSRPVWGVNWFEARAYANWLNKQERFRDRLNGAGLGAARVELPIEAQWERAARAAGLDVPPDDREYVWKDAKVPAELLANIGDSGLREASPVGLFPSSPLGICDLNGNLWEWQDNLYHDKGQYLSGMRIPPLISPVGELEKQSDWLAMAEKFEDSASPALRGGAWGNAADNARASIRNGDRPVDWFNDVGFRVVLSLPN